MKPLSYGTDSNLVKALAHPLRVQILGALERRTASPNELAEELGAPLGNVSYHMRQLASFGLVKLVKETPRRGAVEHYYKLDVRPAVSEDTWAQVPAAIKSHLVESNLSQIGDQISNAAEGGGFDRTESHISRIPLTLDQQGFAEASEELTALAARLGQIEAASSQRLAAGDGPGEAALAVLMLAEAG